MDAIDEQTAETGVIGLKLYEALTNSRAFAVLWGSARRPNSSPDYDGSSVVRRYKENVGQYVKLYHEAVELTKKDAAP